MKLLHLCNLRFSKHLTRHLLWNASSICQLLLEISRRHSCYVTVSPRSGQLSYEACIIKALRTLFHIRLQLPLTSPCSAKFYLYELEAQVPTDRLLIFTAQRSEPKACAKAFGTQQHMPSDGRVGPPCPPHPLRTTTAGAAYAMPERDERVYQLHGPVSVIEPTARCRGPR